MDPEFEKTYRDYYPKLFRIATKMLQDSEGAKDVVQDVFTAYYFAMNNEKVIRDTKNWLVRSTINKGIDYKRKTARTVTMEKPIFETGEQTLDEASDILNAITHLNEKEQTLVVLYSKGQSISTGSFQCEDYDLALTKKRFVCHNGFYYGIQVLKNCDGMPLRLVRFRAE